MNKYSDIVYAYLTDRGNLKNKSSITEKLLKDSKLYLVLGILKTYIKDKRQDEMLDYFLYLIYNYRRYVYNSVIKVLEEKEVV